MESRGDVFRRALKLLPTCFAVTANLSTFLERGRIPMKPRALRKLLIATLAACAANSIIHEVKADDWIAGSGSFGNAANWSAGVPGTSTVASFAVGGGQAPAYTVTLDKSYTNAQLLAAALPTLDLAGHTYTIGSSGSSTTGVIQLSQGAVLSFENSTGTGIINAHGTVIAGGVGGTITSTLNLQAVQFNAFDQIQIGNDGGGAISLSNGATVSSVGTSIGSIDSNYSGSGATGSATLSGTGTSWTDSSTFFIGNSASGSLSITNGAALNTTGVEIGFQAGVIGTATISGTGSSWKSSSGINVGSSGTGSVTISSGAQVDAGGSLILAALSAVSVSGSGSQLKGLTDYSVNDNSSMSTFTAFDFTSGAVISGAAGQISNATVKLDDAQWNNTGDANLTNATYALTDGASISDADIFGTGSINANASSVTVTADTEFGGSFSVTSGGTYSTGSMTYDGGADGIATIDGTNSSLSIGGLLPDSSPLSFQCSMGA
jgi:T5SS/PEP-CTERM-associated repeat protein